MPPDVLASRRAGRDARVSSWRQILAGSTSTEFVAENDAGDQLLGFSSTGRGRDHEPHLPGLELMALYVRAAVYDAGVGYALLREAIADAAAYLWVLDGNVRAIRFYERQGFLFDGGSKVAAEGVERRMARPTNN